MQATTEVRHAEFERISRAVRTWSPLTDDVSAVALIGSWARGTASMGSDVDIVVLTSAPEVFIGTTGWIEQALGCHGDLIRTVDRGALTERRVQLDSGLEVEFGIAKPSWATIDPVDPGTRRVVTDGCRVWYDRHGHVAALLDHLEIGE